MNDPPLVQGSERGTNEQTRRRNLSALLTLLHRRRALSRAELTRLTGLNRSTVGGLVAELSELGLVFETQPKDSGIVGRPSPRVHAVDTVVALTVNPDIDAITIGLVGLSGTVHKRIRYETGSVPTVRETVNLLSAVVEGMRSELVERYTVVGVGLAVPGLVNRADGVVTLAPHLGWVDEPLTAPVSAALGWPAVAANDASVGTIAESHYGRGRGLQDLVYLNGSASGIGGGVLVDGRLLRGSHGYAGELGHTVVNPDGLACHCGRTGCLETEVARHHLLAVLGADSGAAEDLDRLLATSTDPAVRAEVARQVDWLAVALSNFVQIFDPRAVVLGGFLGSLHLADPDRLGEQVRGAGFSPVNRDVIIDRAELGPALLMVGAAELVFADLLADPAGRMPAIGDAVAAHR